MLSLSLKKRRTRSQIAADKMREEHEKAMLADAMAQAKKNADLEAQLRGMEEQLKKFKGEDSGFHPAPLPIQTHLIKK